MFSFFGSDKTTMVTPETAIQGRNMAVMVPGDHHVNGNPIAGPFPDGTEVAVFGMGCFWGAERAFWTIPGVHVTAVGYAGGFTENPTYHEVCTAKTGHSEVVQVVYDPKVVSYTDLLKAFWDAHDPTQGMRQGNDVGTQYRSFIGTTTDEQSRLAQASKQTFETQLRAAGFEPVTTEIARDTTFWYAEDYHQQYLSKNPGGYCGLRGTGVSCAIGGEAVA